MKPYPFCGATVPVFGALISLSVTLHGALLFLPMPFTSEPEADGEVTPAEAETLSVVTLPSPDEGLEPPPTPATSLEAVTARPSISSGPEATSPREDTFLQTDVISPDTAPPPLRPEPEVPVMPPPGLDQATSELESTPTPVPTAPEPVATRPEQAPASQGLIVALTDDFPHFEGATTGCFGLSDCQRVDNVTSYRTVARSLVADLEDEGYVARLRDDLEDDKGRQVYELTPPDSADAPQYLLVFSDTNDLGAAVYVVSHEILTFSELQALHNQSANEPTSG